MKDGESGDKCSTLVSPPLSLLHISTHIYPVWTELWTAWYKRDAIEGNKQVLWSAKSSFYHRLPQGWPRKLSIVHWGEWIHIHNNRGKYPSINTLIRDGKYINGSVYLSIIGEVDTKGLHCSSQAIVWKNGPPCLTLSKAWKVMYLFSNAPVPEIRWSQLGGIPRPNLETYGWHIYSGHISPGLSIATFLSSITPLFHFSGCHRNILVDPNLRQLILYWGSKGGKRKTSGENTAGGWKYIARKEKHSSRKR